MTRHSTFDPQALDDQTLEAHPQFASTVAAGLAVLSCFRSGGPLLGNKEIADRLQLTRPTISRLTFTLVGLGYLRKDPATGKYALGPAILTLGYPMLLELGVRRVAAPEMMELACHARGSISVGTRDRQQIVYVETVHGDSPNLSRPDVGVTRPILRTAIGRAILHATPAAERELLEARLQLTFPEDWEKFRPAIVQAHQQIDQHGYCAAIGEWRSGLSAVAAPLRKRVHGLPLAINLTVPSFSTSPEQLADDLGPRLVALVRGVEYKLGLNEGG